jgi:ankyrin repeat protein
MGFTPFQEACRVGADSTAKLLHSHGASVHSQSDIGVTIIPFFPLL